MPRRYRCITPRGADTTSAPRFASPAPLPAGLTTLWESEDAIRRFAGAPIGRAVFYPEDNRFLVDRDTHVDHFEVVFQAGGVGP